MLMYSKWYCTLVQCIVHGPLGPPRLARAAAPDDQQFMAPAAPPPPSSVGSHHAPQPHNGHPGVLSPLSPAPYVSIQQPRICSKLSGLKSSQSGPLHPLSAAGMGSVKSLDNDNRWSELAEVAHFGFPPPPDRDSVSIQNTAVHIETLHLSKVGLGADNSTQPFPN